MTPPRIVDCAQPAQLLLQAVVSQQHGVHTQGHARLAGLGTPDPGGRRAKRRRDDVDALFSAQARGAQMLTHGDKQRLHVAGDLQSFNRHGKDDQIIDDRIIYGLVSMRQDRLSE
jgi:hypothetical protein